MTTTAPETTTKPPKHGKSGARKQIRGSSLLFSGQLLAKVVNFAVHVLIVRYLSESDYGAFAWAISMVKAGEAVSDFGLHRAISRYVPFYQEHEQYQKAYGTVLLTTGTIVSLGCLCALGVYVSQDWIAGRAVREPEAVQLLLILIFLSPLEALDRMTASLLAAFASAKAIFFRRHVLGPLLKLLVVLLLVICGFNVSFLAAGYVVATMLGIAVSAVVLVRALAADGLLEKISLRGAEIPWREVLLFTIPLLSTDLVHMLMSVLDAVLLGYYGGTADVAAMRAVQPMAKLNQIVFSSFLLLFTPQAARLFARDDRAGINHLYWQTASWIAILTFPVFVLSFSLAGPVTVLLFGEEYRDSGVVMALLSLGYYVQAAFGFNGTTLTIYKQVRYIAISNFVLIAMNVAANFLLIPRYGPLGAAIATCATMIIHNMIKQFGLLLCPGIKVIDWHYVRVYGIIAAAAGGLLVVEVVADLHVVAAIVLAAVVCVTVLRLNRDLLEVEKTFPEFMRLPLVGWLLKSTKP